MKGFIERITGKIPYTNKSVDIPVNGKNLIITGGNGSGKTSFLKTVYDKTVILIIRKQQADLSQLKKNLINQERFLSKSTKGTSQHEAHINIINQLKTQIGNIENGLQPTISDNLQFSAKYDEKKAVVLYFEDKRLANITEAKMAQGVQTEIEEARKSSFDKNVGSKLEQHLLNLRARRSFALTEENNQNLADSITEWFNEFEMNLKHLFEDDSSMLDFNPDSSKFYIRQDSKPPYTFQTLSAGYKAIFDVYADLIMRTKYYEISPLEMEGVVFIDEIDSHLHISLQRLILPFFTRSFPKVQFIATTHSPFVITSTQDTLIYDLNKDELYQISQLKSQSEILSEYLSVPTAIPVWAETRLSGILNRYLSQEPDTVSLAALKEELINAGLEIYFPDSAARILEHNQ